VSKPPLGGWDPCTTWHTTLQKTPVGQDLRGGCAVAFHLKEGRMQVLTMLAPSSQREESLLSDNEEVKRSS